MDPMPPTPTGHPSRHPLMVVFVLLVVALLALVVWSRQAGTPTTSSSGTLTEEQKAKIVADLKAATSTPLTTQQKEQVITNLKEAKAPELTAEQKAQILKNLQNAK